MARSITIHSLDRRNGRAYIRVGKSEVEVPARNIAELRQWVREQFEESDEKILALALAILIARDPDLANPNQIVGRTITIDLTGKLTYPDAVVRAN